MDRKVIILGVLFLVLIGAWAGVVLLPSKAELAKLSLRYEDLRLKERSRVSQMDIQILKGRVDSLDQQLAAGLKRIYPGDQLLDLGRNIDQLGRQYGLKLLAITPDYRSLHLFRQTNQISDLPVNLIFEGQFEQLGRFLDNSSRFPFTLLVHEVSVDKPQLEKSLLTISLQGVVVIGNDLKTETVALAAPDRSRP